MEGGRDSPREFFIHSVVIALMCCSQETDRPADDFMHQLGTFNTISSAQKTQPQRSVLCSR